MIKIILFNGPPGSGKDTIARTCKAQKGGHTISFAEPLYNYLTYCLKLPYHEIQSCKDESIFQEINYKTPRQEMIDFSLQWLKPRFGDDILGKILAEKAKYCIEYEQKTSDRKVLKQQVHADIHIWIPDLGFKSDVRGLIQGLHSEVEDYEFHLVHLYRDGTNFDNDVRKYIDLKNIETKSFHVIQNNGTPGEAAELVLSGIE